MGLFDRLKQGLSKTRDALAKSVRGLFAAFRKIDDAFLDELEETLVAADIGIGTATKLREELQRAYREGRIENSNQVLAWLKTEMKRRLGGGAAALRTAPQPPSVILVTGVNGTGKTTSIAKLARHFTASGKKVVLGACDTFRAAAIDQLAIWAQRTGADLVRHQDGADPAAVAFDAAVAAVARGADVLIVDTAGRLQTKANLMQELSKIRGVLAKKIPGAPHEVLLVIDATTGQNGLSQARHFREAVEVTGIFLAKLDGTARGGIAVAIRETLGIPVKFVGTGETMEDMAPFDPDAFVEALFS